MKRRGRKASRGFTLLSVLMALMIIGILSGMYLAPPGTGTDGGPNYYVNRTQKTACAANRSVLTTKVVAYQIANGRFPTIRELKEKEGVPSCPDGGSYYTLDGQVYCTVHTPVDIPPPE